MHFLHLTITYSVTNIKAVCCFALSSACNCETFSKVMSGLQDFRVQVLKGVTDDLQNPLFVSLSLICVYTALTPRSLFDQLLTFGYSLSLYLSK